MSNFDKAYSGLGIKPGRERHRKSVLDNISLDDLKLLRTNRWIELIPKGVEIVVAFDSDGKPTIGWTADRIVLDGPINEVQLNLGNRHKKATDEWCRANGIKPERISGCDPLIENLMGLKPSTEKDKLLIPTLKNFKDRTIGLLREQTRTGGVTQEWLIKDSRGKIPSDMLSRMLKRRNKGSWHDFLFPENPSKWILWNEWDNTDSCLEVLSGPMMVQRDHLRAFTLSESDNDPVFDRCAGSMFNVPKRNLSTYPLVLMPPVIEGLVATLPRTLSRLNEFRIRIHTNEPKKGFFFIPGGNLFERDDLHVVLKDWGFTPGFAIFEAPKIEEPPIKERFYGIPPPRLGIPSRIASKEELVLIKRLYAPEDRKKALTALLTYPPEVTIPQLRRGINTGLRRCGQG
jgi:hypothetical protein